jgi:hypothetical protein
LWFAGHSEEHGVPQKENFLLGPFYQWRQNKAIGRTIGMGTPNNQSNAPFMKSMSS